MSERTVAQQPKIAAKAFTLMRGGALQRKCACGGSPSMTGECTECQNKRLTPQRRSTSETESSAVPPIVHDVLRSPGQPLDQATRAVMKSRFGHDFSRVRVHTDSKAAESARAVHALAYTVGRDVVFGTGQYAPGTTVGRHLIAHELTHTIQQHDIVRLQRAVAPGNSEELLDQAISTAQQALDALVAPASGGEHRPITAGDEERGRNLRIALGNLIALKGSGKEDEILRAVQPILAAAGKASGSSPIEGIRRKAVVGPVENNFEREAEVVANRVSQGFAATDLIQQGEEHRLTPTIQRQGGPGEAVLTGGLVASGPPGWAILAGIAVVGLIAGGIYLATRPRTTSRTRERARPRPRTGRPGDCNTMMTACLLTSLADEPGSVFGQSRCLFCAEVCRREGGIWPAEAPTTTGFVRCDYWNFPSTE